MRKLRLIDVLAFLWELPQPEDPENAAFGRELLGAVISEIHEKTGGTTAACEKPDWSGNGR
jgi:hypothetical protein